MPRYFFNVYYDRAELDEEGEELPDMQAAWREATMTAGQIIQDLDGKFRPGKEWRLEVTDEFANPSVPTGPSEPCSEPWSEPWPDRAVSVGQKLFGALQTG